jgi:hypothetical protein
VRSDLEDDYSKDTVRSIKKLLDALRADPLPDPQHVEGLISWIRLGVSYQKFTLDDLETCERELHDMSRILLTH